jgi:ATP-dependent RNA helicase RhlE
MSFSELGLSAELLLGIKAQNYINPTPIQSQVIPVILAGHDVMAGAQTGTGKTAAFTLPTLQRLSEKKSADTTQPKKVRALILTPTRELAVQVHESVENYGKYLSLTATVVFGGVKANRQIGRLKRGVDIVVATPGRLLDLAHQKFVDLSKIEIFILDEADRMLDMGFIQDVKKIMAMLPKKRQNLLFSATHSPEIKTLCDKLLHEPKLIEVAPRNVAAEPVKQVVHPVDKSRKSELLSYLIGSKNWKQVLVFTRTKHGADRLAKQLILSGLRSAVIHGNKSQMARTKALDAFKAGEVRVLVATDVAARGIDIESLPHVVNFDLPNIPEDYVHRIGRTGRAGNQGHALSLVCIDELPFLKNIEQLIQSHIPKEVIPGYEPDPKIKAEPIQLGRRTPPKERSFKKNEDKRTLDGKKTYVPKKQKKSYGSETGQKKPYKRST